MIEIGTKQLLIVKEKVPAGLTLGHGEDTVLLPNRACPKGAAIGDSLQVFVYTDSEDRPIATTVMPKAAVGEFAYMKVVDSTPHGAFLDWGLDKDLFVPDSQQRSPMNVGRSYVVAVYLDARTNRVAAASRLGEYFDYDVSGVQVGQEVSLLVYGFSDRGAHVVVGGRHNGLIYSSETFQSLNIGDALTGFVSDVRSDNKLDIRLGRLGHDGRLDARSILIAALEKAGGTLPLGDKSDPDAIYDSLGISKKAFKAAVGQLFKAGRVTPGATTTTLLDPRPASDAES